MTALFIEIDSDPRDYAWGQVDGVSLVRGTEPTGRREAELWLGAHPSLPSRTVGDAPWADLAEWEQQTGERLPYLLKVLCAAEPLSLQAHPSTAQAREGFAREDAAGIPVDAPHRNYRDPNAKPELIVALHDGFEALCGFRSVADVVSDLDALAPLVGAEQAPVIEHWKGLLGGADCIRSAFLWLLSGDERIPALVEAATAAAAQDARFALFAQIAEAHPGDPGILGALMLHHLTLRAGACLWLPAGNIHAYLRGAGVELLGPSDNVLRGGLTPKHIDTAELGRVMDARESGDPRLVPELVADGIRRYRPVADDDPGFALHLIEGPGSVDVPGPAVAIAVDGAFTLSAEGETFDVPRGRAVFVSRAIELQVEGTGRLFLASAA